MPLTRPTRAGQAGFLPAPARRLLPLQRVPASAPAHPRRGEQPRQRQRTRHAVAPENNEMISILPSISAGFIAVLIGFTSAAAIVFEAARAAGADQAELASWRLALGIAMGSTCIGLSLRYRKPVGPPDPPRRGAARHQPRRGRHGPVRVDADELRAGVPDVPRLSRGAPAVAARRGAGGAGGRPAGGRDAGSAAFPGLSLRPRAPGLRRPELPPRNPDRGRHPALRGDHGLPERARRDGDAGLRL